MFGYRLANVCTRYKFAVRMLSRMSYEEAVKTLNTLQSNKANLEQMRKEIQSGKKCTHLEEMAKYLQRAEISFNKLDELSVIHVAGTKGKGSTSAMCESILRHHGFKTGFFSSPHLVVVRERIRLNGNIISEEKFSQYFSEIYKKLDATKANLGDMPKYFHFLTVMALHVFLQEKVDVAILEVGIGGTNDSTNIVRNPCVVGITALGLDHTSVLGNTIEEIAKAKAGIMKPGCEAYTVCQPSSAMAVLQTVARDVKCALHIVPDYNTYDFMKFGVPKLPIDNEAYSANASLAIQLSHAWMRKISDKTINFYNRNTLHNFTFNAEKNRKRKHSTGVKIYINGNKSQEQGKLICKIPENTVSGLSKFSWPGRFQRMNTDFAEIFIDGAHTKESLDICSRWFKKQSSESSKVLIFSSTGDRNSENLLRSLTPIKFQSVYFVVPVPYKEVSQKNDSYSIQEHSDLLLRCQKHAKQWSLLNSSNCNISVHECISDAFKHLQENYEGTKTRPSILVTGSLYLVGGALAILDPNLSR